MKPIKKIRKNKSCLTSPQESPAIKKWNQIDLPTTFLSNDSNVKILATDRFHSIPFKLFVQNDIKPLKVELPICYPDDNMTDRFVSRQAPIPSTEIGKIQSCNIFTFYEEDEEELY